MNIFFIKHETNCKRSLRVLLITIAGILNIAGFVAQAQERFNVNPNNSAEITPGGIGDVSKVPLYEPEGTGISNRDLKKYQDNHTNFTPVLPAWSLEKCFETALEKNIAVRQAKNTVSANMADRKTAQYNLLPSVSYNMGHYFSFGKNIDPVTNAFSFESFSGGYTGLGLELDLFSGFKKTNAIKQSALLVKAAQYGQKNTELELLTNITLTYARLLSAEEELKNKRAIIKNTLKEIDIINEKIKVGRLSKYEFYTFNARLGSEQADLVTLRNDSLATMQDLKQLMNISYKENFNIDSISEVAISTICTTDFSQNELVERITSNHPVIKQAEADEQAARRRVKMAMGNYLPVLSVGGNVVSNYSSDQKDINGGKIPLSSQLNNNLGKNIIVSLHIPLFSQMENAGQVKKEKLNVTNAQLNIENAANSITTNVIHLVNDFISAKEKYKATLSALEQNNLSYDVYRERYRLGQISSVELIAAQDILNNSSSKYIEARLQLFFRFKLLELLKKYSAE